MYETDINPNRFLRDWLLGSLPLWVTSAVASVLAWLPIATVMVFILRGSEPNLLLRAISIVSLLILPGAAIGFCAGDAQLNLMRDHLHWNPQDWRRNSAFGGMVGGALVLLMPSATQTVLSDQTQLLLIMPIFAFCLSIAQWWTLRHTAQEAWLWILGNVVGGIVFSGLFFLNQPTLATEFDKLLLLGLWVIAVLSQAAVTGIVMLWLYDRPLRDNDTEREYARVFLEVRTRDKHNRRR